MYNKVRNAYLKCITPEFEIGDRVASYASLIIFEKILGLDDEAARHTSELEHLKIPKKDAKKNALRNIIIARDKIQIAQGKNRLGILGLQDTIMKICSRQYIAGCAVTKKLTAKKFWLHILLTL